MLEHSTEWETEAERWLVWRSYSLLCQLDPNGLGFSGLEGDPAPLLCLFGLDN